MVFMDEEKEKVLTGPDWTKVQSVAWNDRGMHENATAGTTRLVFVVV